MRRQGGIAIHARSRLPRDGVTAQRVSVSLNGRAQNAPGENGRTSRSTGQPDTIKKAAEGAGPTGPLNERRQQGSANSQGAGLRFVAGHCVSKLETCVPWDTLHTWG
jgi:hypothetical protein